MKLSKKINQLIAIAFIAGFILGIILNIIPALIIYFNLTQ
jgi:hypothetical protein